MKSCQHGRTETSCPDCARIHLGIGIMPVTTHDIPDVLRNKENLVAELRTELAAANAKIARLESGRERVLNSNTKVAAECEELQAKVAELQYTFELIDSCLVELSPCAADECKQFQTDALSFAQKLVNKALASTSTQWLDNKLTEAKIEALEEAAVIAQTNSDSNVNGGDYACGCCYEIRRMAADLQGK